MKCWNIRQARKRGAEDEPTEDRKKELGSTSGHCAGSLRPFGFPKRKTADLKAATWFVRVAFTAVFVVNVMCALQFALDPATYASAYELGGVAGEAAVRGVGIAFLMWNATYPAFIVSPLRFRVLGWVILAQQAIGLVGESLLLISLPAGHDVLAASVVRFIAFDGAGLVLMGVAFASMLVLQRRNVLKYGA